MKKPLKYLARISIVLMSSILFVQSSSLISFGIGSTKEDWYEVVDLLNYDSWRQDINVDEKEIKDSIGNWLKTNTDKTEEEIKSLTVPFSSTTGLGGISEQGVSLYPIEDYGGMLFALSKLLVASGVTDESGINPAILYYSSILNKEINVNNVNDWYNDATKFVDTIEKYWCTSIDINSSESLKRLTDEEKTDIIENYLDEGYYVILEIGKYYRYDEDEDKVITIDDSKHRHNILLTGYTKDDDGNTLLNIDDSLSPATDFNDVYSLEDVVGLTKVSVPKTNESRLDFYKDKSSVVPWYLKLIDKDNKIDQSFSKLIKLNKIETSTGTVVNEILDISNVMQTLVFINHNAQLPNNFKEMLEKMKAETKEDVFIDASYRTLNEQENIFNIAKEKYPDDYESRELRAGESEHNAGLAIDFGVRGQDDFGSTKSFEWLCKHAHEYGYILRYPNSLTAIETTGIQYSPQHWRYIGTEHATAFIKYIQAQYEESADGLLTVKDAYRNIEYNGKVFEDYYNEVIKPLYNKTDDKENSESVEGDDVDEEGKPLYSDASLRRIYYFMRHPVSAFGNLIAGLCQVVHNGIGVGKCGNIYNLPWILHWETIKNYVFYYIAFMTAFICIAIILRWIRFMVNASEIISVLIRDTVCVIAVGLIPLLLLMFIGNCFDSLTGAITKRMSNKMMVLETSYDEEKIKALEDDTVTTWELLTDEDLSRNLFRETFITDGSSDSYRFVTVSLPVGYDDKTDKIEYKAMTLKELYETVNYKTLLDEMSDTVSDTSEKYTVFKDCVGVSNDLIDNAKINTSIPKYLYYSCDEFVPVNYERYSDSVFYYFYDYIKYQYLAYWARSPRAEGKVLSNFAKGFVLPNGNFPYDNFNIDKKEDYDASSLNSYKERLELLEGSYLSQAHSGMYLMYTDKEYTQRDGYYKDIFGLSYLFNMTSGRTGEFFAMPDNIYWTSSSIEQWANVSRINYINTIPSYEDYLKELKEGDYSVLDIQPISNIVNSPVWGYYKKSSLLQKGFTPRYLMERWNLSQDEQIKAVDNVRIPWRVYGASEPLVNAYEGQTMPEMTQLEMKLCSLTEKAEKDIEEIISYVPGQTTDDILIFICALAVTSRFNEMFDSYGYPVYPNGIDADTLDMDKIIRLTYAETVVDNSALDTMYMIYDSNGGLFIMILVLLGELMMLVASVARGLLLLMFFIGTIILALNYWRGKTPSQSQLLTGVIWQFFSLMLMHCLLIGANQLIFNLLVGKESAFLRILISLLGLIVYFIVAVVNLAMLYVFMRDIKNYGGALLKEAVDVTKTEVRESMIEDDDNRPELDAESGEFTQTVEMTEEQKQRFVRKYNAQRLSIERKEKKTFRVIRRPRYQSRKRHYRKINKQED